MGITIRVSSSLSHLTGNNRVIKCETSEYLGRCLEKLNNQFPGLIENICDKEGKLLDYINIYVNGENVRYIQGMSTSLKDGDDIDIIPAAAAG